jgi:hypothetical protein
MSKADTISKEQVPLPVENQDMTELASHFVQQRKQRSHVQELFCCGLAKFLEKWHFFTD